MATFEDITFTWKGKDYVISGKPGRENSEVMLCLLKIESIITGDELYEAVRTGKRPLLRISAAYATGLRHAGAIVSNDDVYGALYGDSGKQFNAMETVIALMKMMIPPEHLRISQGKAAGKAAAGAPPNQSSKKPTKSR